MSDIENIKDYIARAIVLRDEFENQVNIKEKFGKFTYLFPTIEDKMICKAIFDIMFTSDIKARKFISKMVDGMSSMKPQNISEMIDIYNQTSVLVYKQMQLESKKVTDIGGEINTEQEKQGSSLEDDRHGRMVDPFIVMNDSDPNRDFNGSKIIEKKGKAVVARISKEELDFAKQANDNADTLKKEKARKDAEEAKREAERLEKYKKSLAERTNKKTYGAVSGQLQRIYDSQD